MSYCCLYFSFKDIKVLSLLISDGENKTQEAIKTDKDNLNHVVYYCTNNIECRRVQVLRYFGENFDAKDCNLMRGTQCDNCKLGVSKLIF